MAKIGDNIYSAGQGSVGNVVMYTMHGKNFIRSKPSKYKDRKSEAQLAQRARMQVVTGFLISFKELIRKTYAGEAVGRAPYHAAKSQVMMHAIEGSYPDFTINKKAALLSKGPLPLPGEVSVSLQEGGLLVEWSDSAANLKQHGRDNLVVIAQDKQSGGCEYIFSGARRTDKRYLWKINMPVSQDELPDIWIAFRNVDETEMSDSMYVSA
jgi:hypothetical protein